MDTTVRQRQPLKVLLELRPALDKHAGIPQQTRLLFRGLSLLDGIKVEGLIQTSMNALRAGLPAQGARRRRLPRHRQIDRLSRVIIMLEQRFLRSKFSAMPALVRRVLGLRERLSIFDASNFKDYIWRRLFARSLPPKDFDTVTQPSFRIARTPWTAMHVCRAIGQVFGLRLFPRLDTRGFNVMIAETPYPGRVSRGTRLVVRYHDAIPLLMPHTISDRRHHQAFHYRALRDNIESGAWFVCVSEATRRDLLAVFPEVADRSVTIHNVVSHEYFLDDSSPARVPEILAMRLNPKVHGRASGSRRTFHSVDSASASHPYLLMVSTIEPRKNHLSLLAAWERLRCEGHPSLRLVLVGHLGWHHAAIITAIRPWVERGDAFFLSDVPSPNLRVLYRHARATICPSFAEGFDLSGIEAMASGGLVCASDLPVHREVFEDAAVFFNPYSIDDLTASISRLLALDASSRRRMSSHAQELTQRYSADRILARWKELLLGFAEELPTETSTVRLNAECRT